MVTQCQNSSRMIPDKIIHFDEFIIYYLIEKTNFKLVVVAIEKNGQCKLCVVDSNPNFKHTVLQHDE